ncbi:hypothetical protein TNCV_517171 [Trichonephila clavipes]|nr:hypothetical protein TNCV_517171 [Trichonephila clavipes]
MRYRIDSIELSKPNCVHSKQSSHYSATRGLLVTNLVILSHGEATRTTPELAHSSPNFHITPKGGHLTSTFLTCIGPFNTAGLQWYQAHAHDTPTISPIPWPPRRKNSSGVIFFAAVIFKLENNAIKLKGRLNSRV